MSNIAVVLTKLIVKYEAEDTLCAPACFNLATVRTMELRSRDRKAWRFFLVRIYALSQSVSLVLRNKL